MQGYSGGHGVLGVRYVILIHFGNTSSVGWCITECTVMEYCNGPFLSHIYELKRLLTYIQKFTVVETMSFVMFAYEVILLNGSKMATT